MIGSANAYRHLRVRSPVSQNHEKFKFCSTAQPKARVWAGAGLGRDRTRSIHACNSAPRSYIHDEFRASLGYGGDSVSKTTPKQTKNTTAATLQGSVAHRQSIYIHDLGPGFSSYPVLPKWKGGREAEEERDGGSMSSATASLLGGH